MIVYQATDFLNPSSSTSSARAHLSAMPSPRKTVLITGCTPGGLGAALCHEFHLRGFHVLATVRNPSKASSLITPAISASSGVIEVLPLDVTSQTSIQECAAQLRTRGIDRLDCLVNNAGAMLIGPLLDTDINEGRKLFEANVWGLLAVTQAFAPALIKAKGSVLNICSIAGAVRMAWQGVYNASKAAATFVSETLRMEMAGLGVKVVTAMVGEVETQIYQGGKSYKLPEGSYYKSVETFIVDQGNGKLQTSNESAEKTAKSLVSDLLSGMSGQTWRGGVAGTAKVAHWLLPGRLFVSLLLVRWTKIGCQFAREDKS
jgi:NAD(P)-dependent dehydrogenase (short-subunit alcohol dehydrogenase family)